MIAPFEEQVPPLKYGGTELVVYNLIENLVKMGHDVTLFATADSQTSARLIPIYDHPLRTNPEMKLVMIREAFRFIGAQRVMDWLVKEDFDIVHNHLGWYMLPFQHLMKTPMVTTIHGANDYFYIKVFGNYANANFISISENQQRTFRDVNMNFTANVYNGIDLSKFRFFPQHQDYLAYLGRMSFEKGPILAIRAAKRTGMKLLMAAKIDPFEEEYFKKKIEPLIDGEQIKYVGEIGHEEKVELLGNAKALIAPIQWDEPFGLYFVEAMACGTPVISMNRGSVPEIIQHRKNGFICKNFHEMVINIKRLDRIDRRNCFERAKDFSSQKMAQGYLEAYKKILEGA